MEALFSTSPHLWPSRQKPQQRAVISSPIRCNRPRGQADAQPIMATSGKEIEEPVFLLAEECENLFNQAHPGFGASFPDHNPLFEDYQERFSAWAAYMGVFAKSSLCLDRRLRRHPDLQDLVIRYLDIVKINLSFGGCSSMIYPISLSVISLTRFQ